MAAFGLIATAVTATAIVESYSNLVAFALAYGLHGWRAAIAPLAADAFIVLGELLLFIRVLRHWKDALSLVAGALMTLWGFILSVGGNVWHAPAATVAELAASGIALPGEQKLADIEPRLNGSRRAAVRVLQQARALSNGKHDGNLVS